MDAVLDLGAHRLESVSEVSHAFPASFLPQAKLQAGVVEHVVTEPPTLISRDVEGVEMEEAGVR